MESISIIVCTYNPNLVVLGRLLDAMSNFSNLSPAHEIIIVDNNSSQSIQENDSVKQFLINKKSARLITENTPGLTSARIRGIEEARCDWVVFFDDDNEPSSDYLLEMNSIVNSVQKIGALGPGIVDVKYIDKKAPKWLNKYKSIFQQRNDENLKFDNNTWWQFCYPFGTGLIVKREICVEYIQRVQKRQYLLSDRKGNCLSSGGDLQIVYTALDMGYCAGVSPRIKLNHLIDEKKSNQKYIARLLYGSAASNMPAYFQCFPNEKNLPKYPTTLDIVLKIYFLLKVTLLKQGFRECYFQFAKYLGELQGCLLVNTKTVKPKFIFFLERILKLR